ncbi:ATP phosphoribosyltransferase [Membranicola marinus]|uniref:ATP phosphoribosyltransferase n=1 Tax=Membranihabitans marinus TaxID=1227546 RepID=A0A953HNK3_9BACT|nr:ATP phosphoribosyltransferase [Membranihabitans marinus]MBY5958897.1 ATP phosphoribosyltransferase [Membranihabitans marinus]
MLNIAIQKSGRMSQDSIDLLKRCGLRFSSSGRGLIAQSSGFPANIYYLRDDDIPDYVEDGIADVGIVGLNVLLEGQNEVTISKKLGFSRCRLSIAIPREMDYQNIQDLDGKEIATSYPVILKNYLDEQNVSARIHTISGSVEIAPGIGLTDGICDIVSTGSTLLSNGLKEVENILNSEAVMISHNNLDATKQDLLDKLIFRIKSVQKAIKSKYILLNAPNDKLDKIIDLLPGMKSPSILPLAEDGWSSVHSVVHEEDFWEVIDQLKEYGAESLLVVPIEKMIL